MFLTTALKTKIGNRKHYNNFVIVIGILSSEIINFFIFLSLIVFSIGYFPKKVNSYFENFV